MVTSSNIEQPLPERTPQSQPVLPSLLAVVEGGLTGEIGAWVAGELVARTEVGASRYGEALHTHNGRGARVDAEQEAFDLLQYLQQWIMERRDEGGDVRRLVLARSWVLAALVEMGLDGRLTGGMAQRVALGRFGVKVEPAVLDDGAGLDAFGCSEGGGAP